MTHGHEVLDMMRRHNYTEKSLLEVWTVALRLTQQRFAKTISSNPQLGRKLGLRIFFVLIDIRFIAIFAPTIRFINAHFSRHIIYLPCQSQRLYKSFGFNQNRML